MKVQVLVRLKPGVLDVQGKAVERGIRRVGYEDIANVRVGRLVEFDVQGQSWKEVENRATELCESLLANTVIESYEIKAL